MLKNNTRAFLHISMFYNKHYVSVRWIISCVLLSSTCYDIKCNIPVKITTRNVHLTKKRKEKDRIKFVQQKSILFLRVSKNVTFSCSSGWANILSTKKQRIHIVIGDCCWFMYIMGKYMTVRFYVSLFCHRRPSSLFPTFSWHMNYKVTTPLAVNSRLS